MPKPHSPSFEILKELERRFAPINVAARRGTYLEAFGDAAATTAWLAIYAPNQPESKPNAGIQAARQAANDSTNVIPFFIPRRKAGVIPI